MAWFFKPFHVDGLGSRMIVKGSIGGKIKKITDEEMLRVAGTSRLLVTSTVTYDRQFTF